MASNPTSNQCPTLLGNKSQPSSALNDILNEEAKNKVNSTTCHYCKKEQTNILQCNKCGIAFCIECFNTIMKIKDSTKEVIPPKEEEKNNWTCFVCDGTCTCQQCEIIRKDKLDKKCLLCKAKTNLIKIDEYLQKLNLSEKEIDDYIKQHSSISLILQDRSMVEKYICKSCYNSNFLVNKFLQGEQIIAQPATPSKVISPIMANNLKISPIMINDNKPLLNPQSEKKETPTNRTSLSQNKTMPNIMSNQKQMQPNVNIMENKGPQFPGMNLPSPQGGFPNQNPFMGTQPGPSSPQALTASFSKIAESLQNFNNHNLQNNYNVLTNVNKFTELLTALIENNKGGENEQNREANATMIKYLLEVVDDLKKQISTIQYYTQMQKYFNEYIMKNLENFMEQVNTQQLANQQIINDLHKRSMPSIPSMPNNYMMNDMMKSMNIPPMPNMPMMMNPYQPGIIAIPNMGGMPPIGVLPNMGNQGAMPMNQPDKKGDTMKPPSLSMPMMMAQEMMPNGTNQLNNIMEMMKKMNDQQNIRMMNQNEQMNSMNNAMGPQMDMGINPQGFNALMFSQPRPPMYHNIPRTNNTNQFNPMMINQPDPYLMQMTGRQNVNNDNKNNSNNN